MMTNFTVSNDSALSHELNELEITTVSGGIAFQASAAIIVTGIGIFMAAEQAGEKIGRALYHATK